MLTEAEIFSRLTSLHTSLAVKLGAQPYLSPRLSMDSRCQIPIYDKGRREGGTGETLIWIYADTISECIAEAEAFVAKMPDPEAKALRDWHRKLGDVIDEATTLALPDEVVSPLRASSQAMHKNLLAAE